MNSQLDSRQVLGAFALIQLNERLEDMRFKLNDASLTNNDILMISSDLQSIYKKLIMSDLDGGLTRQLESFMWNDCFKTPLTRFGRGDRPMFNLMIESGVGFYLGFIQDIGIHFDVPFIKNTSTRSNLFCTTPNILKSILKCHPSKSSVYYIIQNSLVHVGDLLRYRGSFPEALKMYEKSTAVCPANGHPFNQMGVVQQIIDNKSVDSHLSAIYYYCRAVCVGNSFPPAQNNLERLLAGVKNIKPTNKVEDFICQYLMGIGTETAVVHSSLYVTLLSPLVTIGAINASQLFRIIAVTLWAWKRESEKSLLSSNSNEGFLLEIIASVINSLLIAANGFSDIASFYAIPHLKICLEWLKTNNSVLSNGSFRGKLHTGTLCAFLNKLSVMENEMSSSLNYGELDFIILAEEKKLLGFLPFGRAFEHYQALLDESDQRTTPIRICRILKAAECLSKTRLGFIEKNGSTYNEIPFISQISQSAIRAPSKRNVALQSIFLSQNQFTPPQTMSGTGGTEEPVGSIGMLRSVSEQGNYESSMGLSLSRNTTPDPAVHHHHNSAFTAFISGCGSQAGLLYQQQQQLQHEEFCSSSGGDKSDPGTPTSDFFSGSDSKNKEYYGYGSTGLYLTTPPDLSSSTSLDVDVESTDFTQLFRSIWTPMQHDDGHGHGQHVNVNDDENQQNHDGWTS